MRSGGAAAVLTVLIAANILAEENAAPARVPPVRVRIAGAEFGPYKPFTTIGQNVVSDPVNKVTFHLFGHNGGAEFGNIGCWFLGEDGKTWVKISSTLTESFILQNQALAARTSAKDLEAAVRNVYYAGLDTAKEAEAVKGEPSRLVAEAVKRAEDLNAALAATKGIGWEPEAAAQAKPLVERALADLKTARTGLAAGELAPDFLKHCFDAQWALDEAADCLSHSPGPRFNAAAAYDPQNKCIVLFGGDHGDYVMSDTWIYYCLHGGWLRVWPRSGPAPRAGARLVWSDEKKRLVLTGGVTPNPKFEYYTHYVPVARDQWTFDAKARQWTAGEGVKGVAPGTRTYRTVVPQYNPCWYDAAPRGDRAATAAWLARLKPNTWTAVPRQRWPCPERDWGTAVYDPDRDQIYRWTGGHCADHGNQVSTYHPAMNRWSIPHIPEIYGKGMSFNGRPDCFNHTYLHYAYDALSKRLICTSMGGTGIYNPDRREWDFSVEQPFNHHIYWTCTVGTPKGVVLWGQGYFGIMDVPGKTWKRLPVTGALPAPRTDGSALAYDSKHDAIWLASFAGYEKPSGQIWRYDMKTGEVAAMNPAGQNTIARAPGFNKHIRECVYLPKSDLVLFNNFVGGRQAAYDPDKNRWVLLNIPQTDRMLGSVSIGMVYDTQRDLVWGMGAYKKIFVVRIDPQALTVSENVSQ